MPSEVIDNLLHNVTAMLGFPDLPPLTTDVARWVSTNREALIEVGRAAIDKLGDKVGALPHETADKIDDLMHETAERLGDFADDNRDSGRISRTGMGLATEDIELKSWLAGGDSRNEAIKEDDNRDLHRRL
jgi:hypothetical protein